MKNKILKILNKLISKLLISAKRFPEAIISASIAAILAIILNRSSDSLSDSALEVIQRAAMVFALLFPVSLIASNVYERIKKSKYTRYIIDLVILTFGVFYYFVLLPRFDFIQTATYFAVSFAAYLLFIVAVELKIKKGFETFTVNLAVRFFITYFYSLVLYGGISAIFLTINFLFDLNIDNKIYLDILIVVAGLFAPTFFLAEIPNNDTEYGVSKYSNIIRILLLYIVMPIVVIYTAILYVYLIKVIFEGLPENMIANLILWYAIVGTLVTFLVYPFKNTNKWAMIFVKFFPKLILPLLIMLFYSILLRISEYGFTESRYYVIVAGAWVFGSMIYLSIKKEAQNKYLPISLAIIAILTVIGPQSAFNVSKASQNARFENVLQENNMISNGEIIKGINVNDADKGTITSILRYFESRHDLDDLKILPNNFYGSQMEDVFGFSSFYDVKYPDKNRYFSFISRSDSLIDISGYDYMVDLSQFYEMTYSLEENDMEISYDRENSLLELSFKGNKIITKDLSDFARELLYLYSDEEFENQLDPEDLTFILDSVDVNVKIIFSRIGGSFIDEETEYIDTNFVLLIDIK